MSEGIVQALPGLLPAFLPGQRWFGDKARQIAACSVENAARLPGTTGALLVVADVAFADGGRQRYGLVVARRAATGALPALGRLDGGDWLVEASTDPDVAEDLLRGCAAGAEVPMTRGGRLHYGDTGDEARRALGAGIPRIAPLGAEQSNTSLRVGRGFVFKLIRRLDLGENPEVEVGRFLTARTSFRAMAALEGSLTYLPPAGEPATIGVLQRWVESTGDGWRHALTALEAAGRTGASLAPLVDDIRRLGTITADFHAALASSATDPDFAPEPLEPEDAGAWQRELHVQCERALALVRQRTGDWPEPTRRLVAAVLSRIPAAWERLPAPEAIGAGAFSKIRIHGDYHLGQTLKTAAGFVIIDFEGEPAVPIARRRQKHSALRDVAGMLRSFEYALETVSAERPGTADALRASAGLREAFLDAYLAAAASHDARTVPSGAGALARWLAFFEFGKTLYELEYEVNNRPDWVHIPLRGLLHTMEGLDG